MTLSAEAIIALVGVIINLPAPLLILWDMYVRRRRERVNESGMCQSSIYCSLPLPHSLALFFVSMQYFLRSVPELLDFVSHVSTLHAVELRQLEPVRGSETHHDSVAVTGADDQQLEQERCRKLSVRYIEVRGLGDVPECDAIITQLDHLSAKHPETSLTGS